MGEPGLSEIESRIFTIRGIQVMLDSHLAEMYQVENKVFNRAVKRNIERFPDSFRFQITGSEYENLRFQIGTLKKQDIRSQDVTIGTQNPNLRFQIGTSSGEYGGRRYLPYVFTEQGVASFQLF